MIPVPDDAIVLYDVDNEPDQVMKYLRMKNTGTKNSRVDMEIFSHIQPRNS